MPSTAAPLLFHRLLASCYMSEQFFDLVDLDCFGSETAFTAAAMGAVRHGGLLYLTSTDGFCSGGKRPGRSLAAYGGYLRALPWSNEQGLRMVIGEWRGDCEAAGRRQEQWPSMLGILMLGVTCRDAVDADARALRCMLLYVHCRHQCRHHPGCVQSACTGPWVTGGLPWCISCRRHAAVAQAVTRCCLLPAACCRLRCA
jgi:tRNA G26 N,N-dimethylase Trm1